MKVPIAEAAQILRLSERTIRRRLQTGELSGSQVPSQGGYQWLVELPDNTTAETDRTDALIASLEARIAAQEVQLETKDTQIAELHVLLQQAQAALPAPRERRSWWRWW